MQTVIIVAGLAAGLAALGMWLRGDFDHHLGA